MPSPHAALWALRILWLAWPAFLAPALAGALDDRSRGVVLVVQGGLWVAWVGGLLATFVPASASLTAVRLLAPLGVVAALLTAIAGASVGAIVLAVAGSAAVAVVAFSAEVGLAFVQASAYGDERRFPLRPPGQLLLGPLPLAWALVAAPLVGGLLLLGARQWASGVLFAIMGLALVWLFVPRFHQLTRRFLVLVPAGFVVHDHLVLADTALFRKPQLRSLTLALAGTDATDFTGRALGNAVEVRLLQASQVVVAGTPASPRARSVEVTAFLVAPSRPGRLLAEAAERGLPVR